MRGNKAILVWLSSALVVLGGLILLPRGLMRKADSVTASELFWRAEGGEAISPDDIKRLIQQVSDTDATNYPPAVALLLIHGGLPEGVPPMTYIQRLRQIEGPCAKAYLGRLAWHTGQTEKAWAYWHAAVECPETGLFLAQAYLQKGQLDSACVSLKKSLPLSEAARRYRDRLLAKTGCSG